MHREDGPGVTTDLFFLLRFAGHASGWSQLKCKELSCGHKRVVLLSLSSQATCSENGHCLLPQTSDRKPGTGPRLQPKQTHSMSLPPQHCCPSEIQLKPASGIFSKGEKVTRKQECEECVGGRNGTSTRTLSWHENRPEWTGSQNQRMSAWMILEIMWKLTWDSEKLCGLYEIK